MLYFSWTSFNSSVILPASKKLSSSKSKADRSRKTIVPFTPKLNEDSGKIESFDSDWIPKDHLHVKKSVASGGATSGSESEGGAKKRK